MSTEWGWKYSHHSLSGLEQASAWVSHGLVICRRGMTASGFTSSLSLMQWRCLEPPSPGYQGSPEVARLVLTPSCTHRVSCDLASVWSLSLPPRPPASQAWTRALSPSGGHLERSPSPPHRQGHLAPALTHAGCRRLDCAPLWKPTLSQWESLHPKMPRKLLTTSLHSGLAHSQ